MPVCVEAASRPSVAPAITEARTSTAGAITIASCNRAAFTIIEPARINRSAEQGHSDPVFQNGFPNPRRSPRNREPHPGHPDSPTSISLNTIPKYHITGIETPVRRSSSSCRIDRDRRPNARTGTATAETILSSRRLLFQHARGSGPSSIPTSTQPKEPAASMSQIDKPYQNCIKISHTDY